MYLKKPVGRCTRTIAAVLGNLERAETGSPISGSGLFRRFVENRLPVLLRAERFKVQNSLGQDLRRSDRLTILHCEYQKSLGYPYKNRGGNSSRSVSRTSIRQNRHRGG